ncbi:TPA: hypothetical protein N0F65_000823 [Lagenidium giganteum]|uniref:PARP-type domain-containing protein n=1 Tax=Lagenidium giganteum TaxID=4803 RepID=A0AAV2YXW4_9STRA|nr:TPA: hypothetical protein N0F65_000823 [Lagenidium giganteum]
MAPEVAMEMEMPPPPPPRARGRSAWSRCDEAIARVAPTSTTTCQVCSNAIKQGEWQIGLMFIHLEGFMLVEWYHLECTHNLPGAGLDELLETVQNEMTPNERKLFQAAFDAASSCLPGSSSTAAAAVRATMMVS